MKKVFLFILILSTVVFAGSCFLRKNKDVDEKEVYEETNVVNMYGKRVNVIGEAVYTTRWCGGARPTPEMDARHSTPRPVKNTTLIFTHKATGYKMRCKTDENGYFRFMPYVGEWQYQLTEEFYDANINEAGADIPKECDNFYQRIYGHRTLNSDTSDFRIYFSLPCNPCDPDTDLRPSKNTGQ